MSEIVYVLTNEVMPGLVKIGRTTDSVEGRLTQLSSHSGVPLPFECYFAAEVDSGARVEQLLHQLFAEHRVNPKREFFRIEPEKAVIAIRVGQFQEVTPGRAQVDPEETEALERAKRRRPRIRLDALGIYPGARLQFSRDSTVEVTVVEGGRVDMEGTIVSLSDAAAQVLRSKGFKSEYVSGSVYWMFDGELLDDRRRRIEAEQFEEPSG